MTSAVSRVLDTVELLEAILVQLPLPSLLNAQLVCQFINSLIRTSLPLQRRLFLCPSPPRAEWSLNPLLRQHFHLFFLIPHHSYSGGNKAIFNFMNWPRHDSTRAAFLRKDASWLNMFVVQPQPTKLLVSRGTTYQTEGIHPFFDVEWLDHFPEEREEEVARVDFLHGVTMGKLYDLIHSYIKETGERWFSIAFVSRPQGVQMVLRLSTYVWFGRERPVEEDSELYKSEGSQVEVYDLEWNKVKDDYLDGLKLSMMYYHWGRDLTEEKGGFPEAIWQEQYRRGYV